MRIVNYIILAFAYQPTLLNAAGYEIITPRVPLSPYQGKYSNQEKAVSHSLLVRDAEARKLVSGRFNSDRINNYKLNLGRVTCSSKAQVDRFGRCFLLPTPLYNYEPRQSDNLSKTARSVGNVIGGAGYVLSDARCQSSNGCDNRRFPAF